MKRLLAVVLAAVMVIGLAACGGGTPANNAAPANNSSNAAPRSNTQNNSGNSNSAEQDAGKQEQPAAKKTLVVYFSATGTTKDVAEKIAKIEGADLYEITAEQPYSSADLNWHDNTSRTTKEQNDKSVRPAISSKKLDLSGYGKIYVGYPIWWGEEPRILDTFVESYDFTGITMIPFCTSSSSGMGRSGKNLADRAGTGNWQDGKRFGAGPSESTLKDWINK